MVLCACGCGEEIIPKPHHKWKPVKYINGHNPIPGRGKFERTKEQNERMRQACLGKVGREKGSIPWNKGKKCPQISGTNAWNWKGGRKLRDKRQNSKRRELMFIPLNNYFEGSEVHHINKCDVIYIPYEIHHCIPHNVRTGNNMESINTYAFFFLLQQNIDKIMEE